MSVVVAALGLAAATVVAVHADDAAATSTGTTVVALPLAGASAPQRGLDDARRAPSTIDPGWVARTSSATGIPSRALTAYAAADVTVRHEQPSCRLSWAALAGIGLVESGHGAAGGGLDPDGRAARPVVGVALDGSSGVARLPDTDGGALDGDTTHDRAVGPMQFIPATWTAWRVDADGDGLADPQDLDDAALAAARYLCADGRDLQTTSGWRAALLSYNGSDVYAADVAHWAVTYAERGRGR